MAKQKDAKETKGKPETKQEETKDVAVQGKKSTAAMDLAALASKARSAATLDGANRASDGVNVNYISLCQSQAKALDEEDEKMYIKGLQTKEFYIQSKKIRLGKDIRVVPLAFITVYNEFDGAGQDARMVGIWHKDDAMQYPLCVGHFFNRQTPEGHELRPCKWVIVYLPDHTDMDKTVITFKSTGTKVAKEWAKEIDNRGVSSSQCVYKLTAKSVSNAKGKWFEVVPEFLGMVYEFGKDGELKIIEDFAEQAIVKSLEYNKAYQESTLIARRSGTTRPAQDASHQISGKDPFGDDDDDDEGVF